MFQWKISLLILIIFFLLIGITSVSYGATLYLFSGFFIAEPIQKIFPLFKNYVQNLSTIIVNKLIDVLYFFTSILLCVSITIFLLDTYFSYMSSQMKYLNGSGATRNNISYSIRQCDIDVKPISNKMLKFIIEKKFESYQFDQKTANIKPVVTLKEEITGKKIGFFLKEVNIFPLKLNLHTTNQLKKQLKISEKKLFLKPACIINKCSESTVELIDFPKKTFYEARNSIDFKQTSYLNTEIFFWSSYNIEEEIRFAYIPPPYNNLEKFIRLFWWFYSADKFLIMFLGAGIKFVFSSKFKTFLRRRKQVMRSQFMSGDRHINTGGGDYYESINTGGGNYIQGDYINLSQDLTQASTYIQYLIEQLQKRGTTVDVAQEQIAKDMATQAQSNPTVKDKLLKWGLSLGDATVSDVVKGTVKLAIRSAGFPLP
jgi:hypothetical protein